MRVILKDSMYEMNRKQFRGVLDIAKKSVKMGIYAVEKDGIIEVKNETFDSKKNLKKSVAEYEKVCIDGQNIIHDKANCFTRKDIIDYATNAIEKYNERHDLKWGEVG